jgi:hypothetical protein
MPVEPQRNQVVLLVDLVMLVVLLRLSEINNQVVGAEQVVLVVHQYILLQQIQDKAVQVAQDYHLISQELWHTMQAVAVADEELMDLAAQVVSVVVALAETLLALLALLALLILEVVAVALAVQDLLRLF